MAERMCWRLWCVELLGRDDPAVQGDDGKPYHPECWTAVLAQRAEREQQESSVTEPRKVPTVPVDEGCIAQQLGRGWPGGFCPEQATQYTAALDRSVNPFCDEHAARAISHGARPCNARGESLAT